MASEYSLRLKATLDTSSVQQELQRLRTAQQGGAGGGQGGQGGGGNLTSLGTTLARLNTTMVNLQKSIDLLARQFRATSTGGGEVWSPPRINGFSTGAGGA